MNVYFLVEGKTERKVYPNWLKYLAPQLKRVDFPSDVLEDSYYLISGGGFPSILDNHLVDSAADVNASGKFDYFVLALDTDEVSATEKMEEVEEFITNHKVVFNNCEVVILPQRLSAWRHGFSATAAFTHGTRLLLKFPLLPVTTISRRMILKRCGRRKDTADQSAIIISTI